MQRRTLANFYGADATIFLLIDNRLRHEKLNISFFFSFHESESGARILWVSGGLYCHTSLDQLHRINQRSRKKKK